MKDQPLVSIITPLYNRATLVGETIDSVIRQTYPQWELLIVDDGSTDGSYKIADGRARQEGKIRVLKRDREPKGAPTCRNIGLERASGTYVIFLDSDDLLAPHCLTQRVKASQNYPDHDFLVFPVQLFEQEVGDRQTLFFRYFHQDYLTSFLLQSHWITMSPIWRREALLRLGGFDETLTCMQDGDLHTRALIDRMKFKVFREKDLVDGYLRVSTGYRRISNSISREKLASKFRAKQKALRLLSEQNTLTDDRKQMIIAHFLNIGWNYGLLGDRFRGMQIWKSTYTNRLCSRGEYLIGKSFIYLVSMSPFKRSTSLVAVLKKAYRWLLPKFWLWL